MAKEFWEIITGFKRAMRLVEIAEKRSLFLATGIMMIVGFLTNLPAVIIGRLVDQMTANPNFPFTYSFPFIGIIILILIIREGLTIIRKLLIENVATHTEKKQIVQTIEHLLKTDITYVSEQQIGSLHGRVIRSIQGLVRIIKLSFLEFLPTFFSAIAAILLALSQKPLLAGVMILVIPTGVFIIIKQISSQKGIRVALLEGKERIDGAVVEMLGGLETIRVADTTHYEVSRIDHIAESLRSREIKHHLHMALFDASRHLNEGICYILVVSLAIFLSTQGLITRGDILVYSILFISITAPLREIHRMLDHAHESSLMVNNLYELLNQPLDSSFRLQSSSASTAITHTTALVYIKNLSFAYPGKPTDILRNVSLSIKSGEKIGIVGASGDGKTTLIKILLRLVHNYSGEICLFGKNLHDLSRQEIAEKVAYVPQKPYIFSGTIRDNITYGCHKKEVGDQQVVAAARKAHIYDEIVHSLGGLEERVTENGNNVSGGQKQRLAIARLILKSPELFIFDEATSALDNTNEAIIQKNLTDHFKNQTIITVAHRLTTLKDSDRIIVFSKGKIVQEGRYNHLATTKGLFQDFLRRKDVVY